MIFYTLVFLLAAVYTALTFLFWQKVMREAHFVHSDSRPCAGCGAWFVNHGSEDYCQLCCRSWVAWNNLARENGFVQDASKRDASKQENGMDLVNNKKTPPASN